MIAMGIGLGAAAVAHAQVVDGGEVPDFNAQRFRPAIDAGRTLWVDDARMPVEGAQARVLLSYHHDPLVYRTADEEVGIVRNVLQANVIGGWGIGPVRIGLDVPIYLFADGQVTDAETGLGDVGIDARFTVFGEEAPVESPVDVGVQGRLILPTATVDTALGAPDLAGQLALVGSIDVADWRFAANVGTRIGPEETLENVVLDDAFEYRFGGAYDFDGRGGIALEFAGFVYYSAEVANRAGSPFEGLLSGYGRPTEGLMVRGGVGRGFTAGVGSPDIRLIAGLSVVPKTSSSDDAVTEVGDSDNDGIADDKDACPTEAEDIDTFEDDDGCPDPTTDVVLRVVDPDGDPVRTARLSRTQGDGEPTVTKGGKHALDLEPGDWRFVASAPGYEDTEMTYAVENGPPLALNVAMEPTSQRIKVVEDQIELSETIQFQTASARLLRDSLPLLDEIAGLLTKYPQIAKLAVEGHTDSRGDAAANLDLSARRAATVVTYLVNSGIAPERLSSEGFGETRPLDESETPEAWEKNRRVEIRILEWTEAK